MAAMREGEGRGGKEREGREGREGEERAGGRGGKEENERRQQYVHNEGGNPVHCLDQDTRRLRDSIYTGGGSRLVCLT